MDYNQDIETVDPLSIWNLNLNETFLLNFYNTSFQPSDDYFTAINNNNNNNSHKNHSFFNGSSFVRTNNRTKTNRSSGGADVLQNNVVVPLYAVIFLLSVVGNSLVILTLAQNKRMRTVTNVYLLNLSVSDLLLGVFCMPFTLVGQLLRNFIFGKIMCKLIPYCQAVSVSVAVWTLVAISLERYFAICRPLSSRRWQTQFHAYKMIGVVWLLSFISNSPLLFVQKLSPVRRGGHGAMKCREVWPSKSYEQAYVIFLDLALLLIPLISMSLAYLLIVSKLWRGLRHEIRNSTCQKFILQRSPSYQTPNSATLAPTTSNSEGSTVTTLVTPLKNTKKSCIVHSSTLSNQTGKKKKKTKTTKDENKQKKAAVKFWFFKGFVQVRPNTKTCSSSRSSIKSNTHLTTALQPTSAARVTYEVPTDGCESATSNKEEEQIPQPENSYKFSRHAIRSNYMDKSIEAKKKVIRMLFVIILEFFVCWAPIHIVNTIYLFSPAFLYHQLTSTGIALVQLMAYMSSCCNPITYCFMNRRFRQAFLSIFDCKKYLCCGSKTRKKNNSFGLKRQSNFTTNAAGNSDASPNESTNVYTARGSGVGRSEVVVLDAEDLV